MNILHCSKCQPDEAPGYICPGCIDKMLPRTNAQRQAALKARRKAAGLVPVTVWVHTASTGVVRAFAAATVQCHKDLTKFDQGRNNRET